MEILKSKDFFKSFSTANRKVLPFCMTYEWWNEVVADNWEVVIAANEKQVYAIWPYYIREKGPWKIINNPYFTPYSGPFISYPDNQKNSSRISFENKTNLQLIESLPAFAEFEQNFHIGFKNSLSFLWKDFEDHKHYTYLLDLKNEKNAIWDGFRENTRRQIRKAEKHLIVSENSDALLVEQLLKDSYKTQPCDYPNIPSVFFERILNYMEKYQTGISLKASDKERNIHAAICCLWDEHTAYYLIGGASQEFKNSGAISLLLWQSIQHSRKLGKQQFNFEGSTVKPIEKFLRGFGGNLSPIVKMKKQTSNLFNLAKKLK